MTATLVTRLIRSILTPDIMFSTESLNCKKKRAKKDRLFSPTLKEHTQAVSLQKRKCSSSVAFLFKLL